jgi:uncharacterized protein YlaI
MKATQQNKCALCGEVKKLDIDHDHITHEVRGLLCRQCNWRVAEYEHIMWRDRIIAYLQNPPARGIITLIPHDE